MKLGLLNRPGAPARSLAPLGLTAAAAAARHRRLQGLGFAGRGVQSGLATWAGDDDDVIARNRRLYGTSHKVRARCCWRGAASRRRPPSPNPNRSTATCT